MEILKPHIKGKDIEYIDINRLYVKVVDYGAKYILKQVLISHGVHTWIWDQIKVAEPIDIREMKTTFSFDEAINRAINDIFCTVYSIRDYQELIFEWDQLVYNSKDKTIYKGKKNGD